MPGRSDVSVVGAGESLRLMRVRLAVRHARRQGRPIESQRSW